MLSVGDIYFENQEAKIEIQEETKTMKINRTCIIAQIAIGVFIAFASTASLSAQVAFYAETTATLSTASTVAVPIPGLTFTLPAATATNEAALVTLNLPNLNLTYPSGICECPYAGFVQISVDGVSVAQGGIAIQAGLPTPMTVVAKVPRTSVTQTIEATWGVTEGTDGLNTNTFASLSAILVKVMK